MISKQYFEETFSLATAQALQAWADSNLITQGLGDYGMKISYLDVGEMFAETEVTGLTVGNEYTLSTETIESVANRYRTKINTLPNDNTSNVTELGYGTGKRNLIFTATAETMYIAIGDETGGSAVYSIVDNVSLKIDGVEAVSNGTFEAGNTTGWYAQSGNATLSVYSYVATPIVDNPYLKEVNIPLYDVGNPAHCLIPTDAPWSATTLNNATWTNFYVEAGTYTGKPNVNMSGTAITPRTISMVDSDIHPALLNDAELSKISIKLDNCSHWHISGMADNGEAYNDWGNYGNFTLGSNTSDIILDRLLFKDFNIPISVKYSTDNHTIQKCYFDTPSSSLMLIDHSCIALIDNASSGQLKQCTNHRIILNDFRNYKPMRLANDYQDFDAVDYSGLVVDSNSGLFDGDTYCDADGTPNPTGDYAQVEANWGGVKAGSRDISNPVIFSNNTLIGAKLVYPQVTGNLSPGSGGNFTTVYYDSKYVHHYGNVLYECGGGIVLSSRSGNQDINPEVVSCNAEYNILHTCGIDGNTNKTSIVFKTSNESRVAYNVIKDGIGNWADVFSLNGYGNYFGNNDVINTDFTIVGTGSDSVDGLATNNDMTTVQGDTKYTQNYTITTHRYTSSPQTTVVANVLQVPQEDFIQSIWDMS